MKTSLLKCWLVIGISFAALAASAHAQVVEFRATINAAQETTASTSPATGWAVLLYDVATNRFDLTLQIDNLANTITASHIHEAPAGTAGPVVTNLGADIFYAREGSTVRGSFSGVAHGGAALTLLQNGAYLNFHSAAFPGGEVRGQLIAQPKRLVAVLNAAQEVPATASEAYGAAYISYNPGTNKITTRINLYNFTNTLTNSHYHQAPRGTSGGVVHGLGGAGVYTQTGTSYGAVFADQTYGGDPVQLLTGGAYLNMHSNVNAPGEIRGQVMVSDELEVPRLVALAARGFVGTGDQVLINGFVIAGGEPVRVLVTARGPSLTAAGVAGALGNPMIALHDGKGRRLVENDDFASGFSAGDLASTGFAPSDGNEAALLLVLPPGVYSTVVSGSGGSTGVALTEVYEVRADAMSATLAATEATWSERRTMRVPALAQGTQDSPGSRAIELCAGVPLLAAMPVARAMGR